MGAMPGVDVALGPGSGQESEKSPAGSWLGPLMLLRSLEGNTQPLEQVKSASSSPNGRRQPPSLFGLALPYNCWYLMCRILPSPWKRAQKTATSESAPFRRNMNLINQLRFRTFGCCMQYCTVSAPQTAAAISSGVSLHRLEWQQCTLKVLSPLRRKLLFA